VLEAGLPGPLEAVEIGVEGGREVALPVVHRREDVCGAQQGEVRWAGPLVDHGTESRQSALQIAGLLAQRGQDGGQIRAVLHQPVALGEHHRWFGDGERGIGVAAVQQRLGAAGQRIRAQDRGRGVVEQAQGLVGEGDPVHVFLGGAGGEGQSGQEFGPMIRCQVLVPQSCPQECHRTLCPSTAHGRSGGVEDDLVELLAVGGHAEGRFVVAEGFGGAAHQVGLCPRCQGRGQGGGQVAGGDGVPGQVGGRPELWVLEQRAHALTVQRQALTRQQVVLDGLGEQGVPEDVVGGVAGLEHVVVHRFAQQAVQFHL